jgi:hypothetical protein
MYCVLLSQEKRGVDDCEGGWQLMELLDNWVKEKLDASTEWQSQS